MLGLINLFFFILKVKSIECPLENEEGYIPGCATCNEALEGGTITCATCKPGWKNTAAGGSPVTCECDGDNHFVAGETEGTCVCDSTNHFVAGETEGTCVCDEAGGYEDDGSGGCRQSGGSCPAGCNCEQTAPSTCVSCKPGWKNTAAGGSPVTCECDGDNHFVAGETEGTCVCDSTNHFVAGETEGTCVCDEAGGYEDDGSGGCRQSGGSCPAGCNCEQTAPSTCVSCKPGWKNTAAGGSPVTCECDGDNHFVAGETEGTCVCDSTNHFVAGETEGTCVCDEAGGYEDDGSGGCRQSGGSCPAGCNCEQTAPSTCVSCKPGWKNTAAGGSPVTCECDGDNHFVAGETEGTCVCDSTNHFVAGETEGTCVCDEAGGYEDDGSGGCRQSGGSCPAGCNCEQTAPSTCVSCKPGWKNTAAGGSPVTCECDGDNHFVAGETEGTCVCDSTNHFVAGETEGTCVCDEAGGYEDDGSGGCRQSGGSCPAGCNCEQTAPSTCVSCKPGWKNTAAGGSPVTCECDGDNHFVAGETEGTCVCDSTNHFVAGETEGTCVCDEAGGYEDDGSGGCRQSGGSCPAGCNCEQTAPSTCVSCKPGWKNTAAGGSPVTCECDGDNHFVAGETEGTCVCDSTNHFVAGETEGTCVCDEAGGYEDDGSGGCRQSGGSCPAGCNCEQTAPSTCVSCKPGWKNTAAGGSPVTCECDGDNHFVAGETEGTCVCDSTNHFVAGETEGTCVCDEAGGYEDDGSGGCRQSGGSCPAGCNCEQTAPSTCVSCKPGWKNTAAGGSPVTCECDGDNHFVAGETEGTCVCDSTNHFVAGETEGTCVCDEAGGYEDDGSGGCRQSGGSCPAGCNCEQTAPSTCVSCKPGWKNTAAGGSPVTCECDGDNHFVAGETEGTCVCDSTNHFVAGETEGTCVCDEAGGYEDDGSGGCRQSGADGSSSAPQEPEDGSSSAPQEPEDGSSSAPQEPDDGSSSAPQEPDDGSSSAPQEPDDGSSSAPQEPEDGSSSAPQEPDDGSSSAPQEPEDGSSSAPQEPEDGSSSAPQEPDDGSSSAPQEPDDGSSSAPQEPDDGSSSAPQEPDDGSSSAPQEPDDGSSSAPQEPEDGSSSAPQEPDDGSSSAPQEPDDGSSSAPQEPEDGSSSAPQEPDDGSSSAPQEPDDGSSSAPQEPEDGSSSAPQEPDDGSSSDQKPTPPDVSEPPESSTPKPIECPTDYYNRNGTCVYCEYGVSKDDLTGEDVCRPHCSVHIPNCAPGFCPLIQNVYYCNKCENGYITSIDRRFCVLPTCFDNDVNCKECDTNDASKCINCDESNHFKLNQDGKCVCDEEGGYKSENGLCLDETQRSCLGEGKDTLCKICKDETHCETCLDGASLDSNGTCVKSEISIANCTVNKFVNSQEICVTCEGDLKPTFDGKSCVEDGNATCTENIIGCANCSTRGTNVCIVCDETKFFKPTPVEIGGISRCNCIDGLDFFEGQCIKPIPAVTPSAFPPDKIDSLDSAAVPNATDSSQVTFNKGGNYKDDTLYTYNLPQTVNKVEVPSEIQNFQLNVGNGQEVTIVLPESGNDVAVNFTGTSTIKVNPVQSSNLDVVGDGTITINTPNDGDLKEDEVLNIGTIQPTGEEITLKSNEKLNIKKIDVYPVEGKPITTITGTDSGTSCEGLFLQGRSNLVVKNIDLVKDIYIGLLSSLRMDNAKFEKAKFHIKYNRQTPETVFPIVFNGKGGFPHFDGDIVVERQEVEGEIIQEDQEELLISEFNGDSLEESYKACLNYSSHYRGGESFNDPECYNSTNTNGDDANKAYMRSTKSQKKGDDGKKGLSGGAIAGIVIACVVVVAAIIALLVYFLVIKKRNQSTTSTQGDSSIAI